MRPRIVSNASGAIGRLYSPHHTSSSDDGSRTMNLSCAARPECLPVSTTIGPCRATRPSARNTISSYSAGTGRFQYAHRRFVRPWFSRPYSLESSAASACAGVFRSSGFTASPARAAARR